MCGMTEDKEGNIQVSSCLKWFLFAINFLFWLIGILLVLNSMYQFSVRDESVGFFKATSNTLQGKIDRFDSGSASNTNSEGKLANIIVFLSDLSVALLCLGAVLFVVTFFGFLGALRENRCLLLVYDFLLLILILAKVAGLIYLLYHFTVRSKPEVVARKIIQSKVEDYNQFEDVTLLVDFMQHHFSCCGTKNQTRENEEAWNIWNLHPDFTCDKRNTGPMRCSVPSSCCKLPKGGFPRKCVECVFMCGKDTISVDEAKGQSKDDPASNWHRAQKALHTADCAMAVGRWVTESLAVVAAILGSMIVAQIITLCAGETLKDQILRCQKAYEEDIASTSPQYVRETIRNAPGNAPGNAPSPERRRRRQQQQQRQQQQRVAGRRLPPSHVTVV